MDREVWQQWRDAPPGALKQRLCTRLLHDNDRLAQYYVASFSKHSAYYTANMQDDLLQAARIGLLRALAVWQPDKGGFSAVGYQWARHEMQEVVRHASPITVHKRAFLTKAKQDEIARFEAQHGRPPMPAEVGLTEKVALRARMAVVAITHEREADTLQAPPGDSADDTCAAEEADPDAELPDAALDRKRDIESLAAFGKKLPAKDKKEFWSGTRPDLAAKAKAFVEERRGK
jgi:DNA-directed RNA polymerase specialized sigma subunit